MPKAPESVLPHFINIIFDRTEDGVAVALLRRLESEKRLQDKRRASEQFFLFKTKILIALLGKEDETINPQETICDQPLLKNIFQPIVNELKLNEELYPLIEKMRQGLQNHQWTNHIERNKKGRKQPIELEDWQILTLFTFLIFKKYPFNKPIDLKEHLPYINYKITNTSSELMRGFIFDRNWKAIEKIISEIQVELDWPNFMSYHSRSYSSNFHIGAEDARKLSNEVFPKLPILLILYIMTHQDELNSYSQLGFKIHTDYLHLPTFRSWLLKFVATYSQKDPLRFVDEETAALQGFKPKGWIVRGRRKKKVK